MRLVKPSFEILEQGPGLQGIYKQIELAGRTCYKSLDKITEDSAEGFVNRMIKSQHYAMLEHGAVYLMIPYKGDIIRSKYYQNPYSRVNHHSTGYNEGFIDVTTNYRVLVENGWLDDLKYLYAPTKYHEKRITVRFTTDRGVSHEFVRHRVFSFAQESTRYCNYSKDKFGNELTFIIPSWCTNQDEVSIVPDKYDVDWNDELIEDFGNEQGSLYIGLALAENSYLKLLKLGWTPQQARQILPNALKTELVMTGFVSDWQHFFRLRTSIIAETGKPHPDASALADPLYKEFISKGYLEPLV